MKRHTDDCRAWLESYRELRTEAARMWRRHLQLEAQATRITSQLTGMPRSGNSDSGKLLAALADTDEEALRKHLEAVERMHEIERFIDALPTRESRIILRHRYLDLLRWRDLKRMLEKSGIYYEEAQIYRLHGVALREARELWNRRKEANDG